MFLSEHFEMDLSDWASLSTAISGIAVTASLIYLGLQTHQNAKHTRALIHQGAAARVAGITVGLVEADKCAAWIEGNGGLATHEEIRSRQFALHCATAINALEDHYLQHRDGLMDKEYFARNCDTFRGLLRQPGLRAFWNDARAVSVKVAPRFTAFVDSLCSDAVETFTHRV